MDTIFRIFGIYPLQRFDKDSLKPTSPCSFWSRYVLTSLLAQAIVVTPMIVIVTKETTPEEYVQAFVKSMATTTIDRITLAVTFFGHFLLHFTCLRHLSSLKKCILDMQRHFDTVIKITVEEENSQQFYFTLILWISLEAVNISGSVLGVFYKIQSELDLSYMATNSALFGMIVFQIFMLTVPFYFTMVYIEATIHISNYCKTIKQQCNEMVLEESRVLLGIIKEFNKMCAPFLFWIISFLFVYAITLAFLIYVKTTTFTITESTSWYDWCMYGAFVSHFQRTILLIYTFCVLSENVASEVQELKIRILDIGWKKGSNNSIMRQLD